MLFGERYPYTNFHDLNLDWIIEEMKNIKDLRENFLTDLANKLNKPGYPGNPGQILVSGGGDATAWIDSPLADPQSVVTYGADPTGEAYSDDAIASAIEANKGGCISFPQGTYKISRPIKTYDATKEAISIFMNPHAILKTDVELECLLNIGALQSIYTNRYPGDAINRIITGGIFDAENCQYAIYIEDRAIDCIIENTTCIHCTNGIRIGRNTGLSQDVVIRDVYCLGNGSESEGTAIVIYGNDNVLYNFRCLGFKKGIFTIGGSVRIMDSHVVAVFPNGTSAPDFYETFEQTAALELRSFTLVDNFYSDGYYKMADIYAGCIFDHCEYYNYQALDNQNACVFDIHTINGTISILNSHITVPTSRTFSSGIHFDESFYLDQSRLYMRVMNGLTVANNTVINKNSLYDGDMILSDSWKNAETPFMTVSNSQTIEQNQWYILGYIVCPETVQNTIDIFFAGDRIDLDFYVVNNTGVIIRAMKYNDSTAQYEVALKNMNHYNNYNVYAVCIRQTAGTPKVRNCHIALNGTGYLANYNTDELENGLVPTSVDTADAYEVTYIIPSA